MEIKIDFCEFRLTKGKKITLPTLDKKEELLKEKLVNLDEVFVTRIVGVKCHKWT